jgi:hypothetical protein
LVNHGTDSNTVMANKEHMKKKLWTVKKYEKLLNTNRNKADRNFLKFSYHYKSKVLLTYIKSVHIHSIIYGRRNFICNDGNGLALWFEQWMTVLKISFLTILHARTILDHVSGRNIISNSKHVLHRTIW